MSKYLDRLMFAMLGPSARITQHIEAQTSDLVTLAVVEVYTLRK